MASEVTGLRLPRMQDRGMLKVKVSLPARDLGLSAKHGQFAFKYAR